MRLIIARHAETLYNKTGITQGALYSPLTPLGKRQAELLAKRLAEEKIDVVYSSDLGRCKDTLEPLLKIKPLNVNFTQQLREISLGVFEGKPFMEYVTWRGQQVGDKFEIKTPKGESYNEVIERMKNFLDYLMNKEKGKNVLIMTHGMTKRALIIALLEKKDKEFYKHMQSLSRNTVISIINLKDDKNHDIELFYSIDHLGDINEEETGEKEK